jgi:hypothetical protein
MGYRLMRWWWDTKGHLSTLALLGLTVTAAVLTFAGEAMGIGIAYDVSPLLMLRADLDLDFETISPGWLVLGAGPGVVMLGLIRAWWRRPLSIGKAGWLPITRR